MNAATSTDTSPESLRDAMIARIKDAGYTLSRSVEGAMRAVKRHRFVPGAALVDAYASDIVVTKRGPQNEVLSCLSDPSIVALQLGSSTFDRGTECSKSAQAPDTTQHCSRTWPIRTDM
jgi:hypothetical protein